MELSVIIPAYNEADFIFQSLEQLAPHLDSIAKNSWEFVIVDNGSVDNSRQVIHKIQKMWPQTKLIELKEPDFGSALKAGLEAARGNFSYIINVDAWDPIFLIRAWEVREAHDFILGSKRLQPELSEIHPLRKILSWGLNTILQNFLGFDGTDTHGQKLVRMPVVRPLLQQVVLRRGQFDTELTLRVQRAGLRTAEFPIRLKELRPPRNKMMKKITQNFVDICRLKKILKDQKFYSKVNHKRYYSE